MSWRYGALKLRPLLCVVLCGCQTGRVGGSRQSHLKQVAVGSDVQGHVCASLFVPVLRYAMRAGCGLWRKLVELDLFLVMHNAKVLLGYCSAGNQAGILAQVFTVGAW